MLTAVAANQLSGWMCPLMMDPRGLPPTWSQFRRGDTGWRYSCVCMYVGALLLLDALYGVHFLCSNLPDLLYSWIGCCTSAMLLIVLNATQIFRAHLINVVTQGVGMDTLARYRPFT